MEYLTREEVCKILRISKPTLWKYTKQGLIPSYKMGSRVRYIKSEVLLAPIKRIYKEEDKIAPIKRFYKDEDKNTLKAKEYLASLT